MINWNFFLGLALWVPQFIASKQLSFHWWIFHHFCLLLAADKVSQNFSPKHITDYRKTPSKHHSNNVDDRHKSLLIDGNYRKFFTFIRRKFVLIVKTKAVHYNIYHSRPIFQFTHIYIVFLIFLTLCRMFYRSVIRHDTFLPTFQAKRGQSTCFRPSPS